MPEFSITLRHAKACDLAPLLQLEALFPGDRMAPRQFRHHLISNTARLRVAVADGVLAGYALTLLRKGSQVARLYSIVVDPARRGSGLGARLLKDAMVQAKDAGRTRLQLEVREDNTAAMALYRREGFVEFGRIEHYYEDGCAARRFVLALNGTRRAGGGSKRG